MSEAKPTSPANQQSFFDAAPRLVAAATFLTGALSIISAAIPDMQPVKLPILVTGLPVLALAFGGLVLMASALGLAGKMRSAWTLALVVCAHGIISTLVFKPRLIEAVMYVLLICLLLFARKSFYRRSRLANLHFTRLWLLVTLLNVTIAGFFALLWVSHQKGFVEASFLDLLTDPNLGQALRPIAFALLVLAIGTCFIVFTAPPNLHLPLAADEDFQDLSTLYANSDAPHPDNALAFSGDKTFFYGPDRSAAIAYTKTGNMLIAMGSPIGPKRHWKATIDAFRKYAESNATSIAIYAAQPNLLPDLLDLGFHVEKIGENAVIDLPDFSLSGRKREVIRRGSRKIAKRSGGTFEIALPPHSPELLASLAPISDAWLTANGASEKAFSLGTFEPAFLNQCPIGIVALDGVRVAFGTLLVTPDKSWAGIDLMRYDPEKSVTNTMDFLLVEMIQWAREEDYQAFSLAMAPLSGLVDAEYAPLFARIGHLIFERGERFYNFKGLRRFKQKFDPRWEPRYIATPKYWSLPVALALAAHLTNKTAPQPNAAAYYRPPETAQNGADAATDEPITSAP